MDTILATIDRALRRKGLSDAAASKLAVGHTSLIKNFRMERAGEKRYNLAALQKLAEVLDLELYFGPPRDTPDLPPLVIDGDDFAPVPMVGAEASAGPGAFNSGVEVVGAMAFRLDWLRRHDVKPGRAQLVRVTGNSMEPQIRAGDLVLLDTERTEVINGRPYIFTDTDGETRLKRLHRLGEQTLALVSDNMRDHPPELRTGLDAERIKVLGQVVWSGHTWA